MRRCSAILALVIAVAGGACRRMDAMPEAKWPTEAAAAPLRGE